MLNRFLLCAFMALLSVWGRTQGVLLRGEVVYHNSGAKKASNIQVKSRFANPTITQTDGEFQLKYREDSVRPGTRVLLLLGNPDIRVVDERDLKTRIPDNDVDVHTISVLRKKEYEAFVQKGKIIQEKIKDNVTRKIENATKGNNTEKGQLYARKKEDVIGIVENSTSKYLNKNMDYCSRQYRTAIAFLETGDLTKALAALDYTIISTSLTQTNEAIVAARKNKTQDQKKLRTLSLTRKQQLDNLLLKAYLHILNLEPGEAEKCYRLVLESDPQNSEALWGLIQVLKLNRKYDECIAIIQRVLTNNTDRTEVMRATLVLGELYTEKNNMPLAKEAFLAWFTLYMGQEATTENMLAVVNALPSIGTAYMRLEQFQDAENVYRQFKNILLSVDSMNKVNPTLTDQEKREVQTQLALANYNLGLIYMANDLSESATQMYREAMESVQKSGTTGVYELFGYELMVQNAILLYNRGLYDASELLVNEYLQFLQKKAIETPFMYDQALMSVYLALAQVKMAKDQPDKARQLLEYAQSINNSLFAEDNTAHVQQYLQINTTIARLLYNSGKKDEAVQLMKDGIRTSSQYRALNINSYNVMLVGFYTLLLTVHLDSKEMNLAKQAADSILKYLPPTNKQDLRNYQVFVAVCPILARYYYGKGEYPYGERYLSIATKACDYLFQFSPEKYADRKAAILFEYADLYNSWGEKRKKYKETAVEYTEKAAQQLRTCNMVSPEMKEQSKTLHNWVKTRSTDSLLYFRKSGEALDALYPFAFSDPLKYALGKNSVVWWEKALAHPSGKEFRVNLGKAYGNLSFAALLNKEYAIALQYARKGLETAPSEEWIKTNEAHALLYLKRNTEAMGVYVELKNKLYINRSYKVILQEDFDEFKKRNIYLKEMEEVRKLLQMK